MNKKIINEELYRIQEIMGITPKIIKEQEELIKLFRATSDVDSALAREIDNVVSTETRGVYRDLEDLLYYVERNVDGETMDNYFPGLSKKIVSTIGNNPTFKKDFINTIFRTQLDQTTLELISKLKNKTAKPSDLKQLKSSIDSTIDAIKTGNAATDEEIQKILRNSPLYQKIKDVQVDEFLSPAEKTVAAAKTQSGPLGKFRLKFKDVDDLYSSFKAKGFSDKRIIEEIQKKYNSFPITYKKILENYFEPTFKLLKKYKWTTIGISAALSVGLIIYAFSDYILFYTDSISNDVKNRAKTITGYDKLNDAQKLFLTTYANDKIMNNEITSVIGDSESGGIKVVSKGGKVQEFTAEQIGKAIKVETISTEIKIEPDNNQIIPDSAATKNIPPPETSNTTKTLDDFKKSKKGVGHESTAIEVSPGKFKRNPGSAMTYTWNATENKFVGTAD